MFVPEGFDDIDAVPAAPAGRGDRDSVPEGRHTFRVARASDEGPKLVLALARQEFGEDDNRYGWVWVHAWTERDVGKRLLATFLRSIRMSLSSYRATTPEKLVGLVVDAEIVHVQKGDRTFTNVDAFLPPTAQPSKPTPSLSADYGDSIPF